MYRIRRFYFNSERAPQRRVIKAGLTLEEAQSHCSNPETSSRTCQQKRGKDRTKAYGPWFDGYEECTR